MTVSIAGTVKYTKTNAICNEVFSWLLADRSWSSTQTAGGKVTSMTPSGGQTGWAFSPLQWWRSSAKEQVNK